MGKFFKECMSFENVFVFLFFGVVVGVVVVIIFYFVDILLFKVNKVGAGGIGFIVTRFGRIVAEIGVVKFCI